MSRCHALVVGIDSYPGFGPESQLAGAVRDAQVIARALIDHHGFLPGDVVRLEAAEATRDAILSRLMALRQRLRTGDHAVFFFSGHGSQMTDREGDEGDGLDETLVPHDSGRGRLQNRDLSDDEINEWAAQVLDVTPHLTLIFDCCHAATLHRPGWRTRAVPADLRSIDALPPSPVKRWRDVAIGPRPLQMAACRDDEQAYELPPAIAGCDRGAFSFHLGETLRQASPRATWRELFERLAAGLVADCRDQHPQLSGDGIDMPLFDNRANAPRPGDRGRHLLAATTEPDAYGLSLEVFRSRGGAWRRVTDEPSFAVGDRLRVDLRHSHRRGLFVYLVDIGLSGELTLLFPDHEGHEVLDPNTSLSVGGRRGDRMRMRFPENWLAKKTSGSGQLLWIAAESRLATPRLLAGEIVDTSGAGVTAAAMVRAYELVAP